MTDRIISILNFSKTQEILLKFLIDTNVFITLEPLSDSDNEALSNLARDLNRKIHENGHELFVHPLSKTDIAKDKDSERKRLRLNQIEKYPHLPDFPKISQNLELVLGKANENSNDWVDHHFIVALEVNAVDFLVTEDRKLGSKIKRLQMGDRVLQIKEALDLVQDLSDQIPIPPPSVISTKAHSITISDPILNSLRDDYPGFDDWLKKCCIEHRQTWLIPGDLNCLAGFCIVKEEVGSYNFIPENSKPLKICTFKISENYNGFRLGELLLKTIFTYADSNEFTCTFVTVFKKHTRLIELFEVFGFQVMDSTTTKGENILFKSFIPEQSPLDPLKYHILFGPKHFKTDVKCFLIPIQQKFSDLLFPETSHQPPLFVLTNPFGNSIRKAYLCHSRISDMPPGSILVFYRSQGNQGIIAVGVLELALFSSSPEEIARHVAKRTVYTLSEIEELCRKQVKVITFRQAQVFFPEISKATLEDNVFKKPPQSIILLKGKAEKWIKQLLKK